MRRADGEQRRVGGCGDRDHADALASAVEREHARRGARQHNVRGDAKAVREPKRCRQHLVGRAGGGVGQRCKVSAAITIARPVSQLEGLDKGAFITGNMGRITYRCNERAAQSWAQGMSVTSFAAASRYLESTDASVVAAILGVSAAPFVPAASAAAAALIPSSAPAPVASVAKPTPVQ